MTVRILRSGTGAAVTMMTVLSVALAGCGDDDGTGGVGQQGSMVLMMHDAPVDDMKEVWVTVESVTMIGASEDSEASGELVLSEAVRMDLLALDSIAQIVAVVNVEAGAYSKIRLQISDPEFVRNDDSVFAGADIQLVADGHVDLNTQGNLFIVEDAVTIVSLDVDLDSSLQINQTGNGRYILRPQIFVDNDLDAEERIIIKGATILTVDLTAGEIVLSAPGTPTNTTLVVRTTTETTVKGIGGLPLALSALVLGSTVDVVGEINTQTGVITATTVEVVL